MIKRDGKRIAAIAIAAALMGQNVSPILALENSKVENEETTMQNDISIEEVEAKQEDTTELEDEIEQVEEMKDIETKEATEKSINKITILHTNDTHGRLKADDKVIGIDTVAAIKNNTENSILIDAGDTIHGLPFVTLSKGQDAVDLLNEAGYEYIVPGNHDFNYGYSRLMELFRNSVKLKIETQINIHIYTLI